MTKNQTAKSPNDYPLFGYRVFPEIRTSLVAQLEEVLVLLNENLPNNKKPYKKNDVFIEALTLGFGALKTNRMKKK